MENVVVLLTCFNRQDKTISAIKKLNSSNQCKLKFLIVDDGSTDDTVAELKKLSADIEIINSGGNKYYTGSMRIGMEYLIKKGEKYDYLLLINDDVDFYDCIIDKLILYSKIKNNQVIVGSTIDNNKQLSYGGIHYYTRYLSAKYNIVGPNYTDCCSTFNANCVLIPFNIFCENGIYDSHYCHGVGDFDYGLKITRNGYKIFVYKEYIGVCNRNSSKNTWQDKSLSISKRLRFKKTPKGFRNKEMFHYYIKNFNIIVAFRYIISAYAHIFLRR